MGYRNKLAALSDWVVNYFTFDSPMRLIIRPFRVEGVGATPPREGARGMRVPHQRGATVGEDEVGVEVVPGVRGAA